MYIQKNIVTSLLTSLFWISSQSQLLGLPENAGCGNAGGTCRKLKDCPIIGNPRQSRPVICSFIEREPVICCPPSRALEMCIVYDRMACNGVDIARRRRYAEFQLDQPTTDIVQEESATFIGTDDIYDAIETATEQDVNTTSEPNIIISTLTKIWVQITTTLRPRTSTPQTSSTPGRPSTHQLSASTPQPSLTSKRLYSMTMTSSSIRRQSTTTRSSYTTQPSTLLISSSSTTEIPSHSLNESDDNADDALPRMLPPGFSLSSVSDNDIAEKKIVGGMDASPGELPYMALIGFGTGTTRDWSCGASIISENFVMSAAHCAKSALLGPARWARVAELDLTRDNSPHADIPIIARFVHPGYKEPAVYNDIALFRLGTRLSFSSWVQPLCLQVAPDIMARRGIAAGWGRTDFVGDTSERLLKVDLSLVDAGQCRTQLGRAGRFLPQGVNIDTMICAGEAEGGKDTCTGDSGGPLVVQGMGQCIRTQIGVVSFGRQCAMPNTPGIYTKVSSFIPWIESIVWPQ